MENLRLFSLTDLLSPKIYFPWICVPFLGSKIHPFFVTSVGISIPSMAIVGMMFPFTFDIFLSSFDRIIIWNNEFNG